MQANKTGSLKRKQEKKTQTIQDIETARCKILLIWLQNSQLSKLQSTLHPAAGAETGECLSPK